ncbi:13689_t:CDS:2, partial [Racocetra fulgida]
AFDPLKLYLPKTIISSYIHITVMSEKVKAAVVPAKGAKLGIQLVDKPTPKPFIYDESSGERGELLVKIKAIALNPVDIYQVENGLFVEEYPVILGNDVAGIVEAVGEGVTEFSPGDEICGFTRLGVPGHYGAFSEYTLLEASTTYKKPPNFTFREAATIPVCTLTAGLGLFESLKLPVPSENHSWFREEYILYLNELGAAYTIDYNAPDVVDQIKNASEGRLKYAFDAVGSKDTVSLGIQALSSNVKRDGIEVTQVTLGRAHKEPKGYLKCTNRVLKEVETMLHDGRIRPVNVTSIPGGLDGILPALEKLKVGEF